MITTLLAIVGALTLLFVAGVIVFALVFAWFETSPRR